MIDEGYTKYSCDRPASIHDSQVKPEAYIKNDEEAQKHWHQVKYMDFNGVIRTYCLCDECYDKYTAMQKYFDKDFAKFIGGE